jgi:predicted  nucleic acid-binding Zn-ribbon protein
MNLRSQRGVIDPLTLGLVLGLAGGIFFGKWAPLSFLKPKPPTAQLTALQADLDKAKADTAAKEKALAAAHDAEHAKLMAQLTAAQQFTEGAANALGRAPAASISPEVRVGASLLLRGNLRLQTAIGRLPADLQEEIVTIIDQMLSADAAELAKAQAALAAKDADFKQVTAEREAIKAQIPVLTAQAQKAEAAKTQLETAVTTKTEQVKQAADALDAKAREAGSLSGALTSLWHWILAGACAYVFLAFILPGITGVMQSGPLKNTLRNVSGYLLNPIHHQDAKTTIDQLKTAVIPPKT